MVDESLTIDDEIPISLLERNSNIQSFQKEQEIRDLLGQNPHLHALVKHLRAQVLEAKTIPVRFPESKLTAEEALMKVSNASTVAEIGQHGPAMAAWTPKEDLEEESLSLYSGAFFPRDGLITAMLVMFEYPELLHTTLIECVRLQATKYDPWSEAEPGKIPHEVRDPSSPRAKEIMKSNHWKFPYYGNSDNTGRFILGLAEYIALNPEKNKSILSETVDRVVGDNGETETITMERALFDAVMCLKHNMKSNTEGVVEYKSSHPLGKGIQNQGWRDSGEGYSDKEGRMANHDKGVADLVTNVETYEALQKFVQLFPEQKLEIEPYMNNLRKQLEKFWVEDKKGGYFALALDRDQNGRIQQLDALTSNTGLVLGSELLKDDTDKQEQIIRRLFSSEMLNSAGIRTLSTDHPLYHPDAYHNGTVWPWYNTMIADYLDELGYYELGKLLQERVVISNEKNEKMLFEYYRGDDKPTPSIFFTIVDLALPDGTHLRAAQPPQPFQAWSIAAEMKASWKLEQKRLGKIPSFAEDPVKRKFEMEILEPMNTHLQKVT